MHEITVPRLGWSMEEGTFGEWLKRDGDVVQRGEAVFVLEGEKSAQDIESLEQGILRLPPDGPKPGDTVKVGQVLAYLVEAGEAAPFERIASPSSSSVRGLDAAGVSSSGLPPAAGPAARRLARGMQVDLNQLAGSGAGGKVTPEDIRAAATPAPSTSCSGQERVRISPRARRAAVEMGIDYRALRGTGRGGRIRERDIRSASGSARMSPRSSPACGSAATTAHGAPGAIKPLSPIRKTIAARMLAGTVQTAPVTLTTRCDATNLVNLRSQFRQAVEEGQLVPSYNDLIVKLTVATLARHPQLTHQWHEQGIVVPAGMHIAVAVDTDAGLLAPVLRDVDRQTLRQIAGASKALTEKARAGRLTPDEMQGAVFTITNLGMYGVDGFTPIINLPQSAILGIGRIVREPAVVGETIVPRDQLTLSLTFDHRIVDGAPAARFLQTLAEAVESPGPWLMP